LFISNIFYNFAIKKSVPREFEIKKSRNVAINIESNGETKQAINQH